jgi:hypothetical protein
MADNANQLDPIVDPSRISNADMEMLAFKWERIAEESLGAQSTETSAVHPADVGRMQNYFDDVERWMGFAHGAPILDMPETSKRTWLVQPEVTLRRIENDTLFTVARYALQYRDEALNSQSARNGAGMRDDDFKRHSDYISKMRALFNDYVAKQVPNDQPASSPTFATVDSAKHGV